MNAQNEVFFLYFKILTGETTRFEHHSKKNKRTLTTIVVLSVKKLLASNFMFRQKILFKLLGFVRWHRDYRAGGIGFIPGWTNMQGLKAIEEIVLPYALT